MIPKIIHFCWFGKNPKTELVNYCIDSWKRNLPDYEIIEWNESTFDLENTNVFVKEAYVNKKWAFVSDYVRAYVLYNYGGIYLDTDVEIKHNLDRFLGHSAFSGFEGIGFPFTALWGAQKKHIWTTKVLEYYDSLNSFEFKTNTVIVTDLLVEEFGADPYNNSIQYLREGVVIYPSHFFCLDLELNFATHHFNGSWLEGNGNSFKSELHEKYFRGKYIDIVSNNYLQDLRSQGYITDKQIVLQALKIIRKRIKKKFNFRVV